MKNNKKTTEQLLNEIGKLSDKITELEKFKTERKQEEEALAKKTMLLDNVINRASNVAIATTDLDMRITSYNQTAEKFFGYTAREVIGKSVMEMHLKNNVESERLEKAIEIVNKTGEYNYFVTQELQNGKRVLSSRVSGMLDPGGKLVGYVLFSQDVTELTLAEEALRNSETKYRLLAKNAVDFIFYMDLRLKFIYLSPYVYDSMGYYPEELIGTRLFKYTSRKEFIKIARVALKSIKNYKSNPIALFETKLINKKGEEVPVEISGRVVLNEKGKASGVQGSIRDITDRKQAEEKLHNTEVRFKKLSETAIDAIIMMDPKGLISYWNRAAERIFGYTIKEAVGKEIHKLIAPSRYYEAYKKGFRGFIKTGKGEAVGNILKMDGLKKDNTEFPIEISLSAFQLNEKWHATAIIKDITERKQAEEKLISRNKELELFNEVTVGRELKMLELKKEINELYEKSGEKPKYIIPI